MTNKQALQEALEHFKKELNIKRDCHFTKLERLEERAQNLVNALEEQKQEELDKSLADSNKQEAPVSSTVEHTSKSIFEFLMDKMESSKEFEVVHNPLKEE